MSAFVLIGEEKGPRRARRVLPHSARPPAVETSRACLCCVNGLTSRHDRTLLADLTPAVDLPVAHSEQLSRRSVPRPPAVCRYSTSQADGRSDKTNRIVAAPFRQPRATGLQEEPHEMRAERCSRARVRCCRLHRHAQTCTLRPINADSAGILGPSSNLPVLTHSTREPIVQPADVGCKSWRASAALACTAPDEEMRSRLRCSHAYVREGMDS